VQKVVVAPPACCDAQRFERHCGVVKLNTVGAVAAHAAPPNTQVAGSGSAQLAPSSTGGQANDAVPSSRSAQRSEALRSRPVVSSVNTTRYAQAPPLPSTR
jgi:hypothetical protein